MFKNCWYPLALAAEVTTTPLRVVGLGQDLVAFRQPSGRVVVMSDLCVHRGAALSMGHVDRAGSIVCPYHGWEYDSTGACIKVPAQLGTDRAIPRKARVDAYPAEEAHGLVWAFLGDVPAEERPPRPPAPAPATSSVRIKASYEAVLERALTGAGDTTLSVGPWSATAGALTWHLPSTLAMGDGLLTLLPVGPRETVAFVSASVAGPVASWRTGLEAHPELAPTTVTALARAYRVRRNELIDAGWGIEAHRIQGDGPVAEAVVIPSPTRKEVPELARAWVLKEVPSAALAKAPV